MIDKENQIFQFEKKNFVRNKEYFVSINLKSQQ